MKFAAEDESKAFFQKMIGDYYRYVAESAGEDKIEQVKSGALKGYEEADSSRRVSTLATPLDSVLRSTTPFSTTK